MTTTMIKHHIADDLLMRYAAGTLPEAFDLIIAAHISMCDECRASAESLDAIGGNLIDSCGTQAMSDDSFTRTLDLIGSDASIPPRRNSDPSLPVPLADYVGGSLASVKWRPVGMGVKQAILPTGPEATARLLFIPAGTAVPDHGHSGTELTLVLQGAFEDATARFEKGDVETADADLEHTPIADISEDCICLAVTDAPLRFKGWLPRLAQPFLKI
ncbi:ChrR family anti-sigma-E factor [Primorskyibacter flagellatus]|uniref:ChrR family anti-sigma-E factor n=1 Tax=Primorskyibacter flagellatus TaxID=1387277 RepID=UPI003A8E17B5